MCLVGGKSSDSQKLEETFFSPSHELTTSYFYSSCFVGSVISGWPLCWSPRHFFFFAILYCFLHARPIILIPKISSTNQKNLLNKPVGKEREVPDTHVWIRGAETFPADPTRCLLLFDWPWLRRVTLLAYRRDLARGQRQVSKTIFPEAKLLWKNEYVPAYNLLLR